MRTEKSISSYNRVLKVLVCFKSLFLMTAGSILAKRGGPAVGIFIVCFCTLCPEDFCQYMYDFFSKLIYHLAILL